MSERVALALTNDLAEIARVAAAIETFGQRHGLASAVIFDLQLAVEEILTNVISYAFGDDRPHTIALRLALVTEPRRRVEVEVEDDGRPFDPLTAPPPDVHAAVADRPIGGLGIHLVRRVMSDLAYRRCGDRNVLVMGKAIDPL